MFWAAVLLSCAPPLRESSAVLTDSSPARTGPATTSIFDEWMLVTEPDSTAFAGADSVALRLDRASFTITAWYPGSVRAVISGSAAAADNGGLLTLTPASIRRGDSDTTLSTFAGLEVGQALTLVASAAGSRLAFAPPNAAPGVTSSVWERRGAGAPARSPRTPPTPR
ncbi:MAG: hypothetical protein ACREON_11780 [Gemmatimonadaceae bacterium]